jgi:CheY-like chemotaxis protein/Tfp pilus assembly protein PilZ
MGIENRRFKRVMLKKEVLINGSIRAQGLDLSVGGLYVQTGRDFAVGSHITVTLPLNDKFIHVRARVQNSQPSLGIGIMFIALDLERKNEIETFIASVTNKVPDAGNKTILLVDDNETSRRINKSRLVLDGYSVLEAKDGIEALDLLTKEKIDLMVLDLYMERLDGFQVLSIMREKPEWKEIPVLVLSARNSSDEVNKAISAGATEFLMKMTTSPIKLSQRIGNYLMRRS